ncbi:MAG: hypothetical protein AAF367_03135 [Pseudomonadota bacterium]
MIEIVGLLIISFYCSFLILAFISPFLPIYLMWRTAGLSALALTAGRLLEGPVHWSEKNFAYTMGIIQVSLFISLIALIIIIRLSIAAAKTGLTDEEYFGPQNSLVCCFNKLAAAAIGCAVGIFSFILIAHLLSGAVISRYLDLSVALLAVVGAYYSFRYIGCEITIGALTALSVLAASSFAGSLQSIRILSEGEELADGRPWCLSTPNTERPITEIAQLGFFSLKKTRAYPNLGLIVLEDDHPKLVAHWSIRKQRFHHAPNTKVLFRTCDPINNFSVKLENHEVRQNIFAVGSGSYSVSATYHPNIYTDRIYIQSNILLKPEYIDPRKPEILEIGYKAGDLHLPEKAAPLRMIPHPENIGIDELPVGYGITYAGAEERTGRKFVITCFSGRYDERKCRIRALDSLLLYSFRLPFQDIHTWSEATDKVAALFKSFRVERQHD